MWLKKKKNCYTRQYHLKYRTKFKPFHTHFCLNMKSWAPYRLVLSYLHKTHFFLHHQRQTHFLPGRLGVVICVIFFCGTNKSQKSCLVYYFDWHGHFLAVKAHRCRHSSSWLSGTRFLLSSLLESFVPFFIRGIIFGSPTKNEDLGFVEREREGLSFLPLSHGSSKEGLWVSSRRQWLVDTHTNPFLLKLLFANFFGRIFKFCFVSYLSSFVGSWNLLPFKALSPEVIASEFYYWF